jgi:hypothetical protein
MTTEQKEKVSWLAGLATKVLAGVLITIIGGFTVAKMPEVSDFLNAWGQVPRAVHAVKNQPKIDSCQNAKFIEMSDLVDDYHNENIEIKKDMNGKLDAIIYGLNKVCRRLEMDEIFVPKRAEETSLIEKVK